MHLGGIQMKLVIDSSDIQKIKELNELLTVAGVTTNPTIITKSGRPSEDVINDLIDILSPDQLIFIQVVKTDFEGIMEEAKYINSLREKNMVVKIPVTHEGLKAIKEMQELNKNKDTATRSMITFLVINTASITIMPTTIISLRMYYGSITPESIIPYIIITSTLSCLIGLIIDRLFYLRRRYV